MYNSQFAEEVTHCNFPQAREVSTRGQEGPSNGNAFYMALPQAAARGLSTTTIAYTRVRKAVQHPNAGAPTVAQDAHFPNLMKRGTDWLHSLSIRGKAQKLLRWPLAADSDKGYRSQK